MSDIILKTIKNPRVTEKASNMITQNVYTFNVEKGSHNVNINYEETKLRLFSNIISFVRSTVIDLT